MTGRSFWRSAFPRGPQRVAWLAPGLLLVLCPRAVAAATAAPRAEDVRFTSGGVELAGTVVAPADSERHPAIVFLHGSGPVTRDGAREYADVLVRMGIVSLVFDKRGSGASGGSWTTASLDDLAGDALAAVALLKARPEVDPARIGFFGVSQAGWVATLAASRSSDVRFLVLATGGGVSPRESERYAYLTSFERAGLGAREITQAMGVIENEYFEYLATGRNREAVAAALEAAKGSRWLKLAPLDQILPSEEHRAAWSWVATWDPAPATRQIHCPVLLLFGDRDADFPSSVAIVRWREALAAAGNGEASIVVFPGAGHGIRMRDGFTGESRAPFADGYEETILGWLWAHVVDRGR